MAEPGAAPCLGDVDLVPTLLNLLPTAQRPCHAWPEVLRLTDLLLSESDRAASASVAYFPTQTEVLAVREGPRMRAIETSLVALSAAGHADDVRAMRRRQEAIEAKCSALTDGLFQRAQADLNTCHARLLPLTPGPHEKLTECRRLALLDELNGVRQLFDTLASPGGRVDRLRDQSRVRPADFNALEAALTEFPSLVEETRQKINHCPPPSPQPAVQLCGICGPEVQHCASHFCPTCRQHLCPQQAQYHRWTDHSNVLASVAPFVPTRACARTC